MMYVSGGIRVKKLGHVLVLLSIVACRGVSGISIIGNGTAHAHVHAHGPSRTVTLTVAFREAGPPPYAEATAWAAVKRRIEASNPSVRVRLFPIVPDTDGYDTKLDALLRSADPPDVVDVDSFRLGATVAAGDLLPLDGYLASWSAYKANWYPSMRRLTVVGGHTYGVMNGSDVRVIWYNKRVFRRAGLPASWQPRSWADILAAARAIQARAPGVIPLNLYAGPAGSEAAAAQGFGMLLAGTRDPLYDQTTGKWVVSGRGFLDSLAFAARVYDARQPLGPPRAVAVAPALPDRIESRLLPGDRLGIDIDGSWISSSWYPTGSHPWPHWQQVMGVAAMPTEFGGAPRSVTLAGGWAFAVGARSAHRAEAFALIRAFCDRDALAAYDRNVGNIAPRNDDAMNPAYGATPLRSLFTSLWLSARFRPGLPAYPRVSAAIVRAMVSVTSGTAPADALRSYARAVTGIVGRGNVESR